MSTLHLRQKLAYDRQPAHDRGGGLAQGFVALRHRNYRLFWTGQSISLIGTWMQTIGQAWLVLELSHNAFILGSVSALQFLPVLVFSLFGGVIADKLPKRHVLVATQSSAMFLAFALYALAAAHVVHIWHIFILAALLGLVNAVDTPTRQAFVVEMVGREDLMNAIALNSSQFNAARVVGPAIAGLLIGWLGVTPLFLLNGLSYIAVVIALLLINAAELVAQPHVSAVRQSTIQQLREGLSYVRHTPVVLIIIVLVGVIATFGMNFNVLIPLYAADVLKIGASGFGFLMAAMGLGSLAAALTLAFAAKQPSMRVLLLAATAFTGLEFAFAASRWVLLSALLIAGIGFAIIIFTAMANTGLQIASPDHLRGRVMSVYATVFVGTTPIGSEFTGGLASAWGAPAALVAGAALCAIALLFTWPARQLQVTAPDPVLQLPMEEEEIAVGTQN
jgi:MFS family permease